MADTRRLSITNDSNMWKWLSAFIRDVQTRKELRSLTVCEQRFIDKLLTEESLQLRALRRCIRGPVVVTRSVDQIVYSTNGVGFWLDWALPCRSARREEALQFGAVTSSHAGKIQVTVSVICGLDQLSISGAPVAHLNSDELLSAIDVPRLHHPLLIYGRGKEYDDWSRIFGSFLDHELPHPEGVFPPRRLVPVPGCRSDRVLRLGAGLEGRAIEQYRELLQASNGVNFFGIHLGFSENRSEERGTMVIAPMINDGDDQYHEISVEANNDCGSAFFRTALSDPNDRELYAVDRSELFQCLYRDLENRRFVGTQIWA